MSKTIGIDLGTTNSAVAVMEAGKAKIIHTKEGRNTYPSVVDPLTRTVGDTAKRQLVLKPKQIIFSVKRLMGRKLADPMVQEDKKWLPYELVSGKDGMVEVKVDDKSFTPQEISSMILAKAKQDAEDYLGEKVDKAVITVPAYFDDAERQATKQAGEIAGLEVIRIVNEPTAAALAYGLDRKEMHNIAVYDFGGGTFDITILELGDGVFQVKSTNGDTHLGGDDFDKAIINYLVDEFQKENGIDLKKDSQALQRLKDSAEKAKIELSSSIETEINLPFITIKDGSPIHFVHKLSRAKFEGLVGDLIARSFKAVDSALADAKMKVTEIDEVILVGGMTRVPKMREEVKKYFGKEPDMSVNPDEAVAVGAAIQAGIIGGEVTDVVLLDVTPLTLGVETLGGVTTPLITRNTAIPTAKSEVFSTAADNQTNTEIHILQGERSMAKDNKSLGRFILEGIPPSPRGIPQIEVTFDLDASGILTVKAKEKTTGKEQSIRITGSTGLDKDEIEKMKEDAEKNAESDKLARELVELRNRCEGMITTAEKALKDAGDKIDMVQKEEVEGDIKALKEVLLGENKEEIESKFNKLAENVNKVMTATSSTPAPEADTTQASTTEAGEDNKTSSSDKVEEGEVVS